MGYCEFDIQRTVHRDVFLYWKPTRCTISQIYLIKYSTCFGQVHCPSSGVSQHCIQAVVICHASSVGCLLPWSGWNILKGLKTAGIYVDLWSSALGYERLIGPFSKIDLCVSNQPFQTKNSCKQNHPGILNLACLLTPWNRVFLENLTGSAANQEIPLIFGTRRFITVLTSARHLSVSWANYIQSPQPPPTSWRSTLILSL
jgi:hypothetical protein